MVEFNWTAYAAALAELVATANLNSLANSALVPIANGIEINNGTNRDFYIAVEVYLASVDLSGQTNPAVNLYMFEALDGTNYEDDWKNSQKIADIVGVEPGSAAQVHRVVSRPILIPGPGKYKILPENKTGVAFAGSGNTLKYRAYSEESN